MRRLIFLISLLLALAAQAQPFMNIYSFSGKTDKINIADKPVTTFEGGDVVTVTQSGVTYRQAFSQAVYAFFRQNYAGDVNEDGDVNVSDVTSLVNKILGTVYFADNVCDINGDGEVNVSDITSLVNQILGGSSEADFQVSMKIVMQDGSITMVYGIGVYDQVAFSLKDENPFLRVIYDMRTTKKFFISDIARIEWGEEPDPYQPEAVDMGLSVKWASFNVGATKPEENGDYFAWGEVEPKNEYSWATYKLCQGTKTTITKYCISSYYGQVDNLTTLEWTDDAATRNLGATWRMPTKDEWNELRDGCDWKWINAYNKVGYQVTSKSTGNTIFLPAAGWLLGTSVSQTRYGYYWSSELYMNYMLSANQFSLDRIWVSCDRIYGASVRAVCP